MKFMPPFARLSSTPRDWVQFKKVGLFVGLMSCLFFAASAYPTQAATCTFTNTADSLWSTAANWGGIGCVGVVPTVGDDVVIAGAVELDTPANISSLVVNAGSQLNLSAQTLLASSTVNVAATGYVTSTTGTLNASSTVTIAGTASTTAGFFSFEAGTTVASGGIWDIGGGSATSTGSLDMNGTLYGGTGGVLDVGANFTIGTIGGPVFDAQTGTVRLVGGLDQSISGATYYNLTSLKTAGTATLAANATVGNNLSINGGTLSASTRNLSVTGLSSVLTGATVTSTSGILTFGGAVTNDGSIGTATGGSVFSSTLANAGTFEVGETGASSTIVGSFTSAGTINGGDGDLHVYDSWPTVGTFSGGTGTVFFNGGNAQTIAAEPNFYNLTIEKTLNTTSTILGNVTSTNNLRMTSGGLDLGSNTLYVGGNWVTTPPSSLFDGGTGTVVFNGTVSQGVEEEPNFFNVGVDKLGNLNLVGDVAIGGALTVSSTASVIATLAYNLSVGGITTINSGTTVTSTSGLLTFTDAVTSTGSLGSDSGNMLFSSTFNNNGTFDVGAGTATTTGSIDNCGTINGGSGTLSFVSHYLTSCSPTYTFNAQTGTVRFAGLNQNINGSNIFNNVEHRRDGAGTASLNASTTVLGTLTLFTTSGEINMQTGDLTVVGVTTIPSGTMVTSTIGALNFSGAASSTGSIGSNTGNMLFGSTFQNNGVLDIGAGTATTTDVLTNAGTIYGRTGTLDVNSNFLNTGTFTPGTGTVRVVGTAAQSIPAGTYYNLTSLKTAQVATLAGAATVGGALNANGNGGTISASTFALTVTGATNVLAGATVTSTSGLLTFTGAVENAGSIGSDSSGAAFLSTLHNAATGIFDVAVSSTAYGNVTNDVGGVINGNAGVLYMYGATWLGNGTLNGGTGEVQFNGAVAQTISNTTGGFYNLTINKSADTATLGTNVTSTNNVNLTLGGFDLSTFTIFVGNNWNRTAGTFNGNAGTVTFNGGIVQSISQDTTFFNLSVIESAGTVNMYGHVTATGALVTSGGGTLNAIDKTLYITGASTIGAGTTVTSTSGILTFGGTATNNGTIGSRTGTGGSVFSGALTNNGTFNVGTVSSTVVGAVTNAGTINGDSGTLHVIGNWPTGTLDGGTGTVSFEGSAAQTIAAEPNFYNFVLNKSAETATLSGNVVVNGNATGTDGTLDAAANNFTVDGTLDVLSGAVVTSTSGTLTFTGVASSTGSIGSNTGSMLFSNTFQNNGVLDIGAGTATTTLAATNAGTIYGRTGTLSVVADLTNTGTFTAGSGTVRLMGGAAQSIPGVTYYNLTSLKSGGTATLAGNATIGGALTSTDAGKLDAQTRSLTVTGTSTLGSGTTVTSTSGVLTFGVVTSTGSIGSVSGNLMFGSTLQNNGTLDFGSGNATTTGIATSTGTILARTGTWHILSDFINSGTFTKGTGTVEVAGGATQALAGVDFYNLTINKTSGTTVSLAATATSSNAFVLSSGVFAVGARRFEAPGTYSNTGGLVTISSGSILHPMVAYAFTDVNGTTDTAFSTGDTIYVRATDADRNLSATTTDSFSITVTAAGAGGDSNTVTLTETGIATGIFAGSIPLVYAGVPALGSGQMQVSGSTTGNSTYTDAFDSTDSTSTSASITYVAASNSNNGGGGVGGGGGGSSLTPVSQTFMTTAIDQKLLDNLKKINVPIHGLVKLANDGNMLTQEDSAVYYIGADGKRHAFPNLQTYTTWYLTFDGVQVVTGEQLASVPLGANVTYKPGAKMVKFTTDPKVYAVSKGGILRWIKTETAAIELYGPSWNKNVDDINDAFYANYKFGADINGIGDFNPVNVKASVQFPSDSLQM